MSKECCAFSKFPTVKKVALKCKDETGKEFMWWISANLLDQIKAAHQGGASTIIVENKQ